MENKQKQHYQLENGRTSSAGREFQELEEIAPGVPVIRSCTPRPRSFDTMASYSGYFRSIQPSASAFPEQAPAAPPLPEEQDSLPALDPAESAPLSSEEQQAWLWLFEYGLEMDPAILNSPQRLNGDALFHGPAVLKGYQLQFGAKLIHGSPGTTVVAIVPNSDPEGEVWGVLYRVPQHLAERDETECSYLDTIHAALPPEHLFKGVQVVVHQSYQDQEISAVTYVATDIARQELQLVSPEEWQQTDTQFVQRLTTIAREHKLPTAALRQYGIAVAREDDAHTRLKHTVLPNLAAENLTVTSGMPSIPATNLPPSLLPTTNLGTEPSSELPSGPEERTTGELPAMQEHLLPEIQRMLKTANQPRTSRSLAVFAIYLALLLLIVLTFAVLQGLGFARNMLTTSFAPLGVPWLVIIYGLLGGCVSALTTLGRVRDPHPPLFLVITWFARPFIGAALAIFSYILLTSGLFMLGQNVGRHMPFFWLIGALAGFCEGWLFFKQK